MPQFPYLKNEIFLELTLRGYQEGINELTHLRGLHCYLVCSECSVDVGYFVVVGTQATDDRMAFTFRMELSRTYAGFQK